MKRKMIALIIATPLLLAFPATAEEEGPARDHGQKMFEEVDINGDGVIGRGEFEENKTVKFSEADANQDGQLSYEEALTLFKERAGAASKGGKGKMFLVLDIDGDGLVSFEEFSVMGDRRFKDMDANLDGEVTLLEAKAAGRERQMRRKGRR
ncbi:MAG: EF-hand domain-containing protein [Alphaproteobacteria bacterium]